MPENTVPQPYIYSIASIPGGQFTGEMSNHLVAMIQAYIDFSSLPAGQNPVVESDGSNITVLFTGDLTEAAKSVLDELVLRSSEYLFITYGDGAQLTLTEQGPVAQLTADGIDTQSMRVQLKNGDGSNSNGDAETVELLPASLMPVDTKSGTLNGGGQFTFTLQSSNMKGDIVVNVKGQYEIPVTFFVAQWG